MLAVNHSHHNEKDRNAVLPTKGHRKETNYNLKQREKGESKQGGTENKITSRLIVLVVSVGIKQHLTVIRYFRAQEL